MPESTSYISKDGIGRIPQFAFPMAASSDTRFFDFKNLCSIIKLSVTGTDYLCEASVKSNDDYPFSGRAKVLFDEDERPYMAFEKYNENLEKSINELLSKTNKNYELNSINGLISRSVFVDDNGMESSNYSLNKELNENITPQDVLFSVFDILYEMEIAPKDFKELNNRLSFKLHHHE
jgi:hypothetical protein